MAVELLPAAPPLQPATSAPLASLPAGANAVCWSEDNLLAVATSRSVVLLSAAALDGPRAVIDVPFAQVNPMKQPCTAAATSSLCASARAVDCMDLSERVQQLVDRTTALACKQCCATKALCLCCRQQIQRSACRQAWRTTCALR
jgi:hypothetical protein